MSVRVARIGKPHGVRGEVTVQLYTDEPQERFTPGTRMQVTPPVSGAAPSLLPELTVAGFKWNKHVLVARFEEITDRTRAEEFRGCELSVDVEDLELDEDEWHQEDLLGLSVVDLTQGGRVVGTVSALLRGPAQDLLEVTVTGSTRTVLIPFVEQIVPTIDLEAQRVEITPPGGLLDMDAED